MDAEGTIKVTPGYGWGWVIDGEPRFEVPEPFTLKLEHAERGRWSGVVLDDGHEFHRRRVHLTKRHVSWDGIVNIVVDPLDPKGPSCTGFGVISDPPMNLR